MPRLKRTRKVAYDSDSEASSPARRSSSVSRTHSSAKEPSSVLGSVNVAAQAAAATVAASSETLAEDRARLDSLVTMGFLPGPARKALQAASGNFSMAVDICLGVQPHSVGTVPPHVGRPNGRTADRQATPVSKRRTTQNAAPVPGSSKAKQDTKRVETHRNASWIVEVASPSRASSDTSDSVVLETDNESSDGVAERARVAHPAILPQQDSDTDEGSDASVASGKRQKRGTTRALREMSATAQNVLLDALSGPEKEGETNAALRRRHANVRSTIVRGHTKLRTDHWPQSEELGAKCKSWCELKEHQRVGVRWLLALHRCVPGMILADEMGLGKTVQTLCFLEILAASQPSLVVAPASLLKTWEAEAAKWTPRMRTLKYHSHAPIDRLELQERFFRNPSKYDIIITTPNAFHCKENRLFFFRKINFEYLIVDEAHGLKNSNTSRYREITKHAKCNQRLLLTGTPVQNSLAELATLMGFALSTGKKTMVSEELRIISEEPLDKALMQMQAASAPFILRRLKTDVLNELPSKRGVVVYCEMTTSQRKVYDEEMSLGRSTRLTAGFVKQAFHRLRRVCLHPLLARTRLSQSQIGRFVDELKTKRPDFEKASRLRCEQEVASWSDFEKHQTAVEHNLSREFQASKEELLNNGKVIELLKILRSQIAANDKTLVFSQFTQYLDVIEAVLRVTGIDYVRLDGNTAIDERSFIVARFQKDGGARVFLLSTKAGGQGLNLTAANAVVLLDLDFNPQNNRQAEDRVHRLGQSSEVTVYYLVCRGTVDEMVLVKNVQKMQLDQHFGAKRGALEVAVDADEMKEDVGNNSDIDGDDGVTFAKQCEKDIMQQLRAQLGKKTH